MGEEVGVGEKRRFGGRAGPGSGAAQAGLTLEVQAAPPPGQAFTETLKRQTSASTTQEVSSSAAAVAASARAIACFSTSAQRQPTQ